MATPRVTIADLHGYLFASHTAYRGCLRRVVHRSPSKLPAVVTLTGARLHSSTSRSTPSTPITSPLPQVPFRKQQKDLAKARKAGANHLKPIPNAQHQTVLGWELTVGIEIHAQLHTAHKLFSPSPTTITSSDAPNTNISPFDLALPGSQPLFQPATLIPAIRAALSLNCTVQPTSRWDRKHYFHWDQPSGYQLTQFHEPFARDGYITLSASRDRIHAPDGEDVRVRILQVQMEQDTAKTLAQDGDVHWLDFNRVGVPLIEIITAPDIHHPATAAALVRKVQTYLVAVDACTSGMEAGGLRADVNVSVRRTDDALGRLGQRVEIKNLSSFKAVEEAIIAERDRQIAVLENGGVIEGETRGWSLGSTETRRLRGKEGEVDYRYMPDPDLGPVHIGNDLVETLRATMGILPDEEIDTLVERYGLSAKDASALMLLDDGGRVEYFYSVLDRLETLVTEPEAWNEREYAQVASNWVLHELGRLTSDKNVVDDTTSSSRLGTTPSGDCALLPAHHLADILHLLYGRRITAKVAKDLLFAVYRGDLGAASQSPRNVKDLVEAGGLWRRELAEEEYHLLADSVLEAESSVLKHFIGAKKYPHGKLMFLVGKMMRAGPEGQMDPVEAEKVLRAAIEKGIRS